MISFDVVSLFTCVPLDFTIQLILNKVYRDKLISTKFKRDELERLLQICTKEMHFSFDNGIYRQTNGVAMGSPLGPVIANIFMVELEKTLVPTLDDKVSLWFRYVDDTFTFIKKGEVDNVMNELNNFHPNIKFTCEKETGDTISFLDVKVLKKPDGTFNTDIHRKKTDTNVYLNWKSFAPKTWKIGTLKGLIRRAFVVCSTEEFQNKEIYFLKNVFVKMNGFPSKIVNKALNDVKTKMQNNIPVVENAVSDLVQNVVTDPQNNQIVTPYICLPYKGVSGEEIVSGLRNLLSRILPSHVKPRFIYKGRKLGSCFRVKDRVPLEHQSDLVYQFKPEYNGKTKAEYVGETNVRFGTRSYEHCFTDKKSHVYTNKVAKGLQISQEDFEVLEGGYQKKVDRKLAEALYIKDLKPELNGQKESYKLLLFN